MGERSKRLGAILITGVPGIGKTTVIRKVAAALGGRTIRGFTTAEIRSGRERQGFRLETFDGKSVVLAHVSIRSPHRVGKYGVDVAALESVVGEALDPRANPDVYLVDEIGKMECLSEKFVAAAKGLLDSGKPLVATVALRGLHRERKAPPRRRAPDGDPLQPRRAAGGNPRPAIRSVILSEAKDLPQVEDVGRRT